MIKRSDKQVSRGREGDREQRTVKRARQTRDAASRRRGKGGGEGCGPATQIGGRQVIRFSAIPVSAAGLGVSYRVESYGVRRKASQIHR
jgi:hypothetical protein